MATKPKQKRIDMRDAAPVTTIRRLQCSEVSAMAEALRRWS